MKISTKSQRDFEFFLNTNLDMIGYEIGASIEFNPSGKSALECWYAKDTHGQTLPCREPKILAKAQRGKASWNLQVHLWAQDIADGILLQQDELRDYCHGLPPWIFDATMLQAQKIIQKQIGFIPTFAKIHTIYGQWQPPYMRDFMPSI